MGNGFLCFVFHSSQLGDVFRIAFIHEVDSDPHSLAGCDVPGRGLDLRVPEQHLGLDLPLTAVAPLLIRTQIQTHAQGSALLHPRIRDELKRKDNISKTYACIVHVPSPPDRRNPSKIFPG